MMINTKKGLLVLVVIFILLLLSFLTKPKEYNCSDFKTQLEAYRIFQKHDKDIYHLDRDHDGIPCENLPQQ